VVMRVFQYSDYRIVLRDLAELKKKKNKSFSYEELSKAIGLQRPYLSKTFHLRAHFNNDQLYLAIKYFELSKSEGDYLKLLLEYQRSSVASRKEELKVQLQIIQNRHLETKSAIKNKHVVSDVTEKLNQYYLDPLYQIIHIALSIAHFSENPEKLRGALGIDTFYFNKILKDLEEETLIRREALSIKQLISDVHLDPGSRIFPVYMKQIRTQSLSRGGFFQSANNYFFSVTFTADVKTRKQIQAEFLDFLTRAKELVDKAPAEEVFQMNFDLFDWST